ncbi:hypothetical protein V8E51_016327 [Hyaloscypha variabilis]
MDSNADTNKWLAAIERKANPPIGNCDVYFTVIVVQACCEPGGPWERGNGGEGDLAAMVNNAVQVVRVLNKQFERQPYPALPREMYKEAEKLGLGLDIDLKSLNRRVIKPKLRKRLGRKSNVSQSTGTMSNASDEKSIQAPEITDVKLIQASDDTGVNSVYTPDDTSTKPGHTLPYFQPSRQRAQHHIDLIIRKCPPSMFLMLDSRSLQHHLYDSLAQEADNCSTGSFEPQHTQQA